MITERVIESNSARTRDQSAHRSVRNPDTPDQKRELIARFVAEAWRNVSPETIRNGFIKSGIIPIGPRDRLGRYCVAAEVAEEAPILEDQ